jgi:cytochrome c biogenesis protein CcmG/thiol:disulfide interchange protein DsbE
MGSWKTWASIAAAVAFLGLLGFGLTRDVQKLPSAIIGTEAPTFRAETLSGDSLSLRDLRGDVVVMNFWASWCIPCRSEHRVLVRAERQYADRDARIVGVVYQDSRAAARRFMDRLGGSWPSITDPGSRIAIDYGVYGVPETFFLTRDGRVAKKHIGPLTWDALQGTVDSLLANPAAGAGEEAAGTGGSGDPRTLSRSGP